MKKFFSYIGLFIFAIGQVISFVGMALISDVQIRKEVAKGMADVGMAAGRYVVLDKVISDYKKSKQN